MKTQVLRLVRIYRESGLRGLAGRVIGRFVWRLGEGIALLGKSIYVQRQFNPPSSSDVLRVLRRNSALRDIHAGQTCFIVGSGPSLVHQNVEGLRNGTIISVNENFIFLRKRGVVPNYHVVTDPHYFNGREPSIRFLKDITELVQNTDAKVIIDIKANSVIEAQNFPSRDSFHFLIQVGDIYDYACVGKPLPIDLSRPVPGFRTVMHAALLSALYMGFRTIYLLGADLDYFAHPRAPFDHSFGVSPYNPRSADSVMDLYAEFHGVDYPGVLDKAYRELVSYRHLGDMAKALGRVIYNATPGGLLEVFERQTPPGLEQLDSA